MEYEEKQWKVALKKNNSLPYNIAKKIQGEEIFVISCNEKEETAFCIAGEEKFLLCYEDIEEIYPINEI